MTKQILKKKKEEEEENDKWKFDQKGRSHVRALYSQPQSTVSAEKDKNYIVFFKNKNILIVLLKK